MHAGLILVRSGEERGNRKYPSRKGVNSPKGGRAAISALTRQLTSPAAETYLTWHPARPQSGTARQVRERKEE